jgi:hypothetical protein
MGESRGATALLRVRWSLIPRRRGTAVPPWRSLSLVRLRRADLDGIRDDSASSLLSGRTALYSPAIEKRSTSSPGIWVKCLVLPVSTRS